LQDLCAWLLRRLGVRPRPFRSRLLVFAPAVVAAYLFLWPAASRLLSTDPSPAPGFSNHLLTTDFWKTFPGPAVAALTLLVCGFVAVYFLGGKGFCTYGCPYGAVFGALDRVAAGRIRVTDACAQCGQCTAACTSNVRVHDEVKRYGTVVDPGCMKCLDCVSAGPNGALYFGCGRPASLAAPRPAAKPARLPYDWTAAEEVVAAAVFLAATLSFRGLYDGPPLLLSVGLGGVTAYLALKGKRLLRDRE